MAATANALLVTLTLVPVLAQARDLSRYPCTVFSAVACFRVPAGTRVDYMAPADYELYRISKGDRAFATIYIGDAPQSIRTTEVSEQRTKRGRVRVFRGNAGGLDILISPEDGARTTAIHISANPDADSSAELGELLSSLRPCTPIRGGGQRCPTSDVWREVLANVHASP